MTIERPARCRVPVALAVVDFTGLALPGGGPCKDIDWPGCERVAPRVSGGRIHGIRVRSPNTQVPPPGSSRLITEREIRDVVAFLHRN